MPRRKNNKNPEKNRFRWAIAIGAAVVLIAAVGAFFALSSGSNSRTAEAATGDVLAPPSATIDENCVISILNRSARVKPDGSWRIDNLPANLGRVRARVTCIRDGEVESGQSDLFSIEANVVNGFNSEIPLGVVDPIPTSIEITADSTVLANVGDTTQLTVTATFPDGSTRDVSAASDGTNSNPEVVSVSPTGQVTALASGTVVISALFEGVLGLIQIQVVLDGDSDRDGVPDDLELANGLDPRNGVDGLEDPDVDGLTNKEELVDVGSDMRISDTDGDSLLDGEEVSEANGYVTSALIADSDGDGVRDGLEIATGSDPTNAISVNLAGALDSIEVTPSDFFLSVDPSVGDSSQQVITTGHLADGTDIDLTSTARGTSYSSSDLTICNFGGQPGQVFAGNDGTCLVTVENSGHSASVTVVVRSFAPFGITSIAIPGYANNVDAVSDDFAYVAAGSAGLQVVNVSNLLGSPNLPSGRIVGSLDTPGTSIDIKVVGNLAYIADGEAGLHIVDISNPTNPATRGTVDTPGTAQDLAVVGDKVYIADGGGGLQIIDVGNPSAPRILGSVATDRNAKGVDVSGNLAVVAANVDFLVIDVADATNPQIVGRINQAGNLKDLVVRGNQAYVAAYTSGFLVVDFSTPENPKILSRISSRGRRGFVPRDVALSGQFALAAEQLFPNVVAIADIGDPNEARFRDTLDLAPLGDYAGTGIALTGRFVYVCKRSAIMGHF